MIDATVTLRFPGDVRSALAAVRTCPDYHAAFGVLQARFDGGYVTLADGTVTACHPLDVVPHSIRGIHRNPDDVDAIDVVGVFDI